MAVTNGASHEISSYNGTNYQYIGDTYLAKAATTTGNNSYTLFYDALGRCVKRTTVINGGTAVTDYYLYDGEHWIMEYDANGTNISNAIYGREMDEMIERGVNGQGWWYFPDRNGNISVVTDGVNTVRESYRYDAFGLPTVTVGPGQPAINNRFLFTGREWNTTFGFYEYRARAYNPTIGRFMSEDPKGFDAGDYNLYRYCSNDPLDLTDPMGLFPERDFIAGLGDMVTLGQGERIVEHFYPGYAATVDKDSSAYKLGSFGGIAVGMLNGKGEVAIGKKLLSTAGKEAGTAVKAEQTAGRSFREILKDFNSKSADWVQKSAHTEPLKKDEGASIQTIWENKKSGEQVITHTRVTDTGKVLEEHPRPMYKPRTGE